MNVEIITRISLEDITNHFGDAVDTRLPIVLSASLYLPTAMTGLKCVHAAVNVVVPLAPAISPGSPYAFQSGK